MEIFQFKKFIVKQNSASVFKVNTEAVLLSAWVTVREKNNIYSFLYKLDFIHGNNDFSGILLWTRKYEQNVDKNLINVDNVYKCSYRNDILKQNKLAYETT